MSRNPTQLLGIEIKEHTIPVVEVNHNWFTGKITGWRLINDRIKALAVTLPGESEASKLGVINRVGLIRVIAIEEEIPRPVVLPPDRSWKLNVRRGGGVARSSHTPIGTGTQSADGNRS